MTANTGTTGTTGQTDIREFGHELWNYLTGKQAVIEYTFEDMTVEVPKTTGPDVPRATWKMNALCGCAPATKTVPAPSAAGRATAPREDRTAGVNRAGGHGRGRGPNRWPGRRLADVPADRCGLDHRCGRRFRWIGQWPAHRNRSPVPLRGRSSWCVLRGHQSPCSFRGRCPDGRGRAQRRGARAAWSGRWAGPEPDQSDRRATHRQPPRRR